MNPYEPPENEISVEERPKPRFIIVCGELVIVAGVLGGLSGVLLSLIEMVRRRRGEPPLLPGLLWLSEIRQLHICLIMAFVFALAAGTVFGLIRTFAPPAVVRCFPWWQDRPYYSK